MLSEHMSSPLLSSEDSFSRLDMIVTDATKWYPLFCSQKRHTKVEMIVTNATKWQVSMWAAKAHIKIMCAFAAHMDTCDQKRHTRYPVKLNYPSGCLSCMQRTDATSWVATDVTCGQKRHTRNSVKHKQRRRNEKMLLACFSLRHNTLCFNYCSSCLRGGRKLCLRIPSRESHVRLMSTAQCRLPALFAPWSGLSMTQRRQTHHTRSGRNRRMQAQTTSSWLTSLSCELLIVCTCRLLHEMVSTLL